jgi:hypothetical protein
MTLSPKLQRAAEKIWPLGTGRVSALRVEEGVAGIESEVSDVCLKCTLPDCDESSPQCLYRSESIRLKRPSGRLFDRKLIRQLVTEGLKEKNRRRQGV